MTASQSIQDVFEEKLYAPILSAGIAFFGKIRMMQTGKVNVYLLYIMIILVILLVFVRFQS